MEPVPPRNMFQIVSPKAVAWAADEKLAAPVAPPRDMVTILPRDWQYSMSDARKVQFGMDVPGNTPLSSVLQIYVNSDVSDDPALSAPFRPYGLYVAPRCSPPQDQVFGRLL